MGKRSFLELVNVARHPTPRPVIDTLANFSDKPLDMADLPSFASQDYVCAIDFLKQYNGNLATFEAYRRELERFLQWAWLIQTQSILALTRVEIEAYLAFCLFPPKSWVGNKRVARFLDARGQRIPNPKWRPFVVSVTKSKHKQGIKPEKNNYHLSQKAIREIFTVLGSFYNYLTITEKVSLNPVALIRQKSKYLQKRQTQAPVMRLTDKQWQYCVAAAETMATSNPRQHERTLFILSALYLLYLRISELAANQRWIPQWNHFYQDSHGNWWFKTLGKGNKLRDIAVSESMLTALKRYRKSLNLPPLPSNKETQPLIYKEKGKGALTSTRQIRKLIQACFDKAVDSLKQAGIRSEAEALEAATVHWLRHTGISDDINKHHRPIAHVRDDAGHSSSAITDRYNDIKLKDRHRTAKLKKLT